MQKTFLKHSVGAGAMLVALMTAGTGWAQTASAPQSGTTAAKADDSVVVIVTGLRESSTKALQTKRNAEVVVDSISAQDIGALPDRTVSEALQRVPGIMLQRTGDINTLEGSDPGRVPAEGGGIFVRGLTWTLSEINGHDVFSANSGRAIGFDDIAPDLLGGIDVYKNPSADMNEGSIAGIVDLRTRRPLDSKGFLAVSGDTNYADIRKRGFFSGNIVGSTRWKVGEGEMGLLLAVASGETGNRTESMGTSAMEYAQLKTPQSGLAAGSTVETTNGLGFRTVDWTQKRQSYDAILQYRPNSQLDFTFEATIARVTPNDIEHAIGINDANSGFGYTTANGVNTIDNNSFTFAGPQNRLVSGTINNAQLSLDTRSGQEDKITREYSLNGKWKATDHLTFDADIDYVSSNASVYSFTVFDAFDPTTATQPTVNFNVSPSSPSISVVANGASFSDPKQYFWGAAMDHIEDNSAHSWAEKADATYNFDNEGFFKTVKVGYRSTSKDLLTQSATYNWSLLSAEFWGGGTPVLFTQDPGGNGLPAQTSQFSFGNFRGGNVSFPGAWFPANGLVTNGTANAYTYLKATETAGWGWSPLDPAKAYATTQGASTAYGSNLQHEDTKAVYIMARFGQDHGLLGDFDGNVGVRLVSTVNDAVGAQFLQAPTPGQGSSGTLPAATCLAQFGATACQGLINAYAFSAGGFSNPLGGRTSYHYALPTLNLRFHLTDKLQARVGIGRAMYRPGFSDIEANQSFSFNMASNGYTIQSQTLQGGNPQLRPILATNYDFTLEYYFGRSDALTFDVFDKEINGYITNVANSVLTITRNGVTENFASTIPVNANHGNIKGFEVGYQQFFDQLPGALSGLGVNANATYIEDHGGANPTNTQAEGIIFAGNLPLQGLSRYSYNAQLVYEKYGISARLAYNWRSTYMANANGANVNEPVWMEPYGQLDASILYSLNKNIKVGFQATNITRSNTYIDVGPAEAHPRYAWETTDQHYAFVVRSKF